MTPAQIAKQIAIRDLVAKAQLVLSYRLAGTIPRKKHFEEENFYMRSLFHVFFSNSSKAYHQKLIGVDLG